MCKCPPLNILDTILEGVDTQTLPRAYAHDWEHEVRYTKRITLLTTNQTLQKRFLTLASTNTQSLTSLTNPLQNTKLHLRSQTSMATKLHNSTITNFLPTII